MGFGEGLANFAEKAREVGEKAAEAMKIAFEKLEEGVEAAAKATADAVQKASEAAGQAVGKAGEAIGNAAGTAGKATMDGVGAAGQAAADGAGIAGQAAMDGADAAGQVAMDGVDVAGASSGDGAGNVTPASGDGAGDAIQIAEDKEAEEGCAASGGSSSDDKPREASDLPKVDETSRDYNTMFDALEKEPSAYEWKVETADEETVDPFGESFMDGVIGLQHEVALAGLEDDLADMNATDIVQPGATGTEVAVAGGDVSKVVDSPDRPEIDDLQKSLDALNPDCEALPYDKDIKISKQDIYQNLIDHLREEGWGDETRLADLRKEIALLHLDPHTHASKGAEPIVKAAQYQLLIDHLRAPDMEVQPGGSPSSDATAGVVPAKTNVEPIIDANIDEPRIADKNESADNPIKEAPIQTELTPEARAANEVMVDRIATKFRSNIDGALQETNSTAQTGFQSEEALDKLNHSSNDIVNTCKEPIGTLEAELEAPSHISASNVESLPHPIETEDTAISQVETSQVVSNVKVTNPDANENASIEGQIENCCPTEKDSEETACHSNQYEDRLEYNNWAINKSNIITLADNLREGSQVEPQRDQKTIVEPHNPRYDEMCKRYGDWWGYDDRTSLVLPFIAFDKAKNEKLKTCPICHEEFDKNSRLLSHLSKGVIDTVRNNTPLDNQRVSAGSHSFVDARRLRNNGESLASALGLTKQEDIDVIEHLKGFPVTNLEDLSKILDHTDWKAVWDKFLRKGLGEAKLKARLDGMKLDFAKRYGLDEMEVEWNHYLRTKTIVHVHEADSIILHNNKKNKPDLLVPWEAKLHASIRSTEWSGSMANVLYTVVSMYGFINGYGIMVTKNLTLKAFIHHLQNNGSGRIITMADGGKVEMKVDKTNEEGRYDLDLNVTDPNGNKAFSNVIDFWVKEFDFSNDDVEEYIKGLQTTMENKLLHGQQTSTLDLQSTTVRRLTQSSLKKNYKRYDEIMTIIENFTRSGRAAPKSLIMKECGLTEKELEATLEGLQRNGQIIRLKELMELPSVNPAKAETVVSKYVPNTRMAVKGQARWYIATNVNGRAVNSEEIVKHEIEARERIREALNKSELVGSLAETISADIRTNISPGYGVTKVSNAISRQIEFFLDNLFLVTGIRVELGRKRRKKE